jgi:hypothetical protein
MHSTNLRGKICCGAGELKTGIEKRPFNSEDGICQIGFSASKTDDEGQFIFLLDFLHRMKKSLHRGGGCRR